jgi:hypothetical protein
LAATLPLDYDREKLQERLAKLAGGVAVTSSSISPIPPPPGNPQQGDTAAGQDASLDLLSIH